MADDYIILFATLAGVVVGFILTALSAWCRNRRDADSFRRVLYVDVIRILTRFHRIIEAIDNNLGNEQLQLDTDSKAVDRLLKTYSGTIESTVKMNWYDSLRAHPFLFLRLSPEERKSTTELYEALSMQIAERNVDTQLDALRTTIAQPKDRIIAFKKQLEEDVDSMELFVRNGLDEALLLEMSTTDHERALVKQAFLPKFAV